MIDKELEKKIIDMLKNTDKPLFDIAKELGCKMHAVHNTKVKNDIVRKRDAMRHEKEKKIVDMLKNTNLRQYEIAYHAGVNQATVSTVKRKYNIQR